MSLVEAIASLVTFLLSLVQLVLGLGALLGWWGLLALLAVAALGVWALVRRGSARRAPAQSPRPEGE